MPSFYEISPLVPEKKILKVFYHIWAWRPSWSCDLDYLYKKVQVGKDQEKAQSEKDSHSKNRGGKKTKPTIRYLYHENIS